MTGYIMHGKLVVHVWQLFCGKLRNGKLEDVKACTNFLGRRKN